MAEVPLTSEVSHEMEPTVPSFKVGDIVYEIHGFGTCADNQNVSFAKVKRINKTRITLQPMSHVTVERKEVHGITYITWEPTNVNGDKLKFMDHDGESGSTRYNYRRYHIYNPATPVVTTWNYNYEY